jgi:hypothetical protein
MRARVTRFKSLLIALKELEQFIRNGLHLRSGKPFKSLGNMRSREAIANWLLCVAANHCHGNERFWFSSDPNGGDGIINDKKTKQIVITEHVMALRGPKDTRDGNDIILEQIKKKVDKGGAAYASGKTLIVFAEDLGIWNPTDIAKALPSPLHFSAVWVLGLKSILEDESYLYFVTRLDLTKGNPPVWSVAIAKDFNSWIVEP